jgi:hypothetical protein
MLSAIVDGFVDQLGGEPRQLTDREVTFLAALLRDRPWLDVWRHEDDDGTPWLIVSLDVVEDRTIVDTWRLDFDGSSILGGRSPASLNWDDGVRAHAAGVDASDAGIEAVAEPEPLARLGGEWFDERRRLGVSS